MESQRGLDGAVIFNSGLFDEASARRLHGHYLAMIDRLLADPTASVATIVGGLDVAELHTPVRGTPSAIPTAPGAPAIPSTPVTAAAAVTPVADGAAGVVSPTPSVTPSLTPTEKVLAEVWEGLLDMGPVERLDNFFDLGGSSLLAMQAVELIAARTGRRVPPGSFAFETLAQIAHAIDAASAAARKIDAAPPSAAPGHGKDAAGGTAGGDASPGLLRKLGSLFRR